MRSSSGKPKSLANWSAPSATSMMWSVRSMTSRATELGVLMLRSDATDPALYVRPSITDASSSTIPSAFGSPPYPTLVSLGSTSMTLAPRSTASSAEPPPDRMPHACSIAFRPVSLVWLVMMIGRSTVRDPASREASSLSPSSTVPAPAATPCRRKFRRSRPPRLPFMVPPWLPEPGLRALVVQDARNGASPSPYPKSSAPVSSLMAGAHPRMGVA
jgi:hypothetical protein